LSRAYVSVAILGALGETNIEIVRAVYAAWNREDFPGPSELLDPDIEYVNPPDAVESGTRRGLGAFAQAVAKTLEGWETWRMELDDLESDGDDVAVVLSYRARGRTSGVEMVGRESALWTVRDGRVVRYAWFRDADSAKRALDERVQDA
jgi:ketosteroid isomerase-like protein